MQVPDMFMAAANVIFIVSLLPTIIHQYRVKASTVSLWTAAATVTGLSLVLMALVSLNLWLALATDIVNTAQWSFIAWQRWHYGAPLGLTGDNRLRR